MLRPSLPLAQTLREQRLAAGLTQAALAARIGVSTQTVIRYETGRSDISVARLAQMADALGVPPAALWPERQTLSPDPRPTGELVPSDRVAPDVSGVPNVESEAPVGIAPRRGRGRAGARSEAVISTHLHGQLYALLATLAREGIAEPALNLVEHFLTSTTTLAVAHARRPVVEAGGAVGAPSLVPSDALVTAWWALLQPCLSLWLGPPARPAGALPEEDL